MTHSLQIVQLIPGRRTLLFGMPSVFIGTLIISLLAAPAASALSLSVKLDPNVPILAPLSAQARVTLLDSPSDTLIGASARVTTPGGVIAPPTIAVPLPSTPPRTAAPDKPVPAPVPPTPASSPASSTDTDKTAVASTGGAARDPVQRAQSQAPLLITPEAFDLMPKTFADNNKNFAIALIVLATMAAVLLGFTAYTTARLARGSPTY